MNPRYFLIGLGAALIVAGVVVGLLNHTFYPDASAVFSSPSQCGSAFNPAQTSEIGGSTAGCPPILSGPRTLALALIGLGLVAAAASAVRWSRASTSA